MSSRDIDSFEAALFRRGRAKDKHRMSGTSEKSSTRMKSHMIRDPKPLTRAEVVARKEAIRDWIAQRDPSEYVVPTPGEHGSEPQESLPEGYKPEWTAPHVAFPEAYTYRGGARRK